MDVDAERLDDEKNRTVNKLIDLCLSLTQEVMRLKDLIESSRRNRRMAAAKLPPPIYTNALIEPFIREVRQQQQQQQEEERSIVHDDVSSSDSSWCEDMIDCDDSRRVENRPPPRKRMKFEM